MLQLGPSRGGAITIREREVLIESRQVSIGIQAELAGGGLADTAAIDEAARGVRAAKSRTEIARLVIVTSAQEGGQGGIRSVLGAPAEQRVSRARVVVDGAAETWSDDVPTAGVEKMTLQAEMERSRRVVSGQGVVSGGAIAVSGASLYATAGLARRDDIDYAALGFVAP